MLRHLYLLTLILLVNGCAGKTYKVDNPVVGPPPPRMVDAEQYAQVETVTSGDIQQVGYNKSSDEPLRSTDVVARVNGTPILAGAVLEPYSTRLAQVSSQMTKVQIREAQEKLIQRDLDRFIEQTLMADSVKSKLKPEQLEEIEKQLDHFFQLQTEEMKKQAKVETLADLEGALQDQGLSLASMRRMFGERQLASEYVRAKVGDPPPITPEQLKAEYKAHLEEYSQPAKVKWQQLQISVTKHGSRQATAKVMDQALAELQSGVDFDTVVKKYSDGPLAANGGHWDWIQPESIANPKVRAAVEKLEVQRLSDVLVSEGSLQVVRVTGRREARYTPFEEVQDAIRQRLDKEWKEQRAQAIIDELKEKAVIETMFDTAEEPQQSVSMTLEHGNPAGLAG
ncbi:MAG: peptidyl-prolyl cis-trans isomerase [Planctomycetaceae bacterium]|nr:peptidyl-prolyl cis-trans isomerase [Planctomycetaceae bacterium]